MVTLREIHHPDMPFFGQTQTLSNEHAEALLALERRIGVQCWEVVPTDDKPAKPVKNPNATDADRSEGKKG